MLGGRCWQINQIVESEKKVYAKCIGEAPAVTKIFEGKGAGSYNYLLAPVIKRAFAPDMDLLVFPCATESKTTHILHLFGSLYGFVLADALFEEGVEALDVEGKMLVLSGRELDEDRFPVPGADAVRKVIADNIRRLEDALGSGAFFYDLPGEYQIEDHFQSLDIGGFLDFLRSLRLSEIDMARFKEIAAALK